MASTPDYGSKLYARQQYWTDELNKATIQGNVWFNDNNLLAWGDSVDIVMNEFLKFRERAYNAIQKPESYTNNDVWDATVKELIAGMYLQIKDKAPKWTQPVWDTVNDIKQKTQDTVKDASTWGAAGSGFGLVLLGALWLLSKR